VENTDSFESQCERCGYQAGYNEPSLTQYVSDYKADRLVTMKYDELCGD